MPIRLIRIDDRLLHGQVVVGWGQRLGLRRYLVVDDELAASSWEQELYAAGLPEGVEVRFLTVEEAAARMEELDRLPGAGALLTRGTAPMRRLSEAGALEEREVNLGCLGDAAGRRRVLDYLHLGPGERRDLREIGRHARHVAARDVPGATAVPLEELLEASGEGTEDRSDDRAADGPLEDDDRGGARRGDGSGRR